MILFLIDIRYYSLYQHNIPYKPIFQYQTHETSLFRHEKTLLLSHCESI